MFALKPWKEREMVRHPLSRLHNEFKVLYDRLFGLPVPFEPFVETERLWGLEIEDAEKEFIVRAEMPGFELPEIEVELRNNRLFIKAQKKFEADKTERSERYYERFVELPEPIEPAKIEAFYHNGVLEIHLSKTPEAAGLRIPVK